VRERAYLFFGIDGTLAILFLGFADARQDCALLVWCVFCLILCATQIPFMRGSRR
jgi:hypothetical protein